MLGAEGLVWPLSGALAAIMSRGDTIDSDDLPGVLSSTDRPPFEVVNGEGRSPVLLVCEHAGTTVPVSLNKLGLAAEIFSRHIALDIGAAGVARVMAEAMDAPLVLQPYSRLVVDCNRHFQAADCFPEVSDTVPIPGNMDLTHGQKRDRYEEIHVPFHRQVEWFLDRPNVERKAVVVSIHSFTPSLKASGIARPWEIGFLFNRDDRLARRLMPIVERMRPAVVAAFNEPYRGSDTSDYTIPIHGERRGIEHVLIEIRNNLIDTPVGQAEWGALLAAAVSEAVSKGGSEQ